MRHIFFKLLFQKKKQDFLAICKLTLFCLGFFESLNLEGGTFVRPPPPCDRFGKVLRLLR